MPRRSIYSSKPAEPSQPVSAARAEPQSSKPSRLQKTRVWLTAHSLWMAVLLLSLVCAALVWQITQRSPRVLTQKDIDAAVLQTLQKNVLPSKAAEAYENVRPSIVRVVSFVKKSRLEDMKASKQAKNAAKPSLKDKTAKKPGMNDDKTAKDEPKDRLAPDLKAEDDEVEFGVGTGVVIVDKGIILTNWHVVQGADRIKITFMDGLEAEADIKGVQAEDDLAVLQARKIPDDLIAATMRSTADLREGDEVIAVGFPFGIGPSTSAGIVSGLKRSFRSPEGGQTMKNLIQFDAAANPGNSGGPLVTMDGEVVGIVTAIMNPTPARTFIGIGFAVPIENAASAAGMPPF
ncbi:trypsin-like peptidase domain-containing protein [Variovorax sp. PCZ-1]|uniref:S1C family serine protease n=1 Tax=Variovorax sp. PCZ-1 TaxID=2835533 RepID=UPI001BCD980E|nr:trypsin-like peptidase domain-containing protein [Variovorax sp. PCZ-1]MBS7806319.1 trypsin-like peptidase domain-containing protein [Variovorax sp. PCZ-1]